MNTYYFTFLDGHHHGPMKTSLKRCYTYIESETEEVALDRMRNIRGGSYQGIYHSDSHYAKHARHNYVYVPFDQLMPQEGASFVSK